MMRQLLPTGSLVFLAWMAMPAILAGQTQFKVPVGVTYPFQLNAGVGTLACEDTLTATMANTAIATVSPATQPFNVSTVYFNITGVSTGTTTLTVAETPANPQCAQGPPIVLTVIVGSPTTTSTVPTSGNTLNAGAQGEPVSTATGELYGYDETPDLDEGGPLRLSFRRYYGSFLTASGVKTALGTNWMSNFDISLTVTSSKATVTLFRGKTVSFGLSGAAWQLSSVEKLPYQFLPVSSGYQFLDPGANIVYSFNSSGALTAIQDRNGNTLTVTQGASGPTRVDDGVGRFLVFTYNGSQISQVQDQAGRTINLVYSSGVLSSFQDARGNTTTYAYTSSGTLQALMTSVTRPNGNKPLSQTYDSQGRVATQSHAVGSPMTFSYPSNNSGATTTLSGGPSLTDAHDSSNNLLSTTDSSGLVSKFTYDSNNRILSSTDRTGAAESLAWDPSSGRPTAYTDQLGSKTAITWASTTAGGFTFYDPASITFADGSTVSYVRDGKGNVTSLTDQAGNSWQYTYNPAGQILTVTNPSGGVTTNTYAADGTLAGTTLNSGDTTSFAVDAAKRPSLVTNPDGTTRSFSYDALNHVTSATNENGSTVANAFDSNNNLKSTTDALNAISTRTYDADDRLTAAADPLGHAVTRAWDSTGRLQSLTDATGVQVAYTYDSLNRPTQILDAAGKGSTLTWDAESRLTSTTDALSRVTSMTRDARGMVTAMTTPKGEKSTSAYDSMGRLSSVTDPLGRTTALSYEGRGLLTRIGLPGGIAALYSYNELRLPTGQTDPRGNLWAMAFDKQGRLISRTDPLGHTISRTYDSRQRVSAVTFPQGSAQFTYDAAGNRTARTYSDGTRLSFTWDANNRLTGGSGLSLTWDSAGRLASSNGLQITRDAAGRIASITYASGKTVKYTWDNRGLLTQVSDWVGGTTTFTYDAAHQLVSRTTPNGVTENYTYDADGRLSSVQTVKGSNTLSSFSLTRDADGRVTSAVRSAPNVPDVPTGIFGNAFDAASQSLSGTYDPLGRITQDTLTSRTYAWDLASRLSSYAGANGSASFTYDAMGQRISSTSPGATWNFVLDYATPLPTVATVQSGGADVRYYVWLPSGTLLESIEASTGARHFYHFDESGSTILLTGDSGTVTDSYAITPYGETVVQSGSTPNPFTFQGAYGVMQEGSTGLFYMRARYYDSTSARFLSCDPIAQADPRSLNPYQFAWANPVERGDPAGLAWKSYQDLYGETRWIWVGGLGSVDERGSFDSMFNEGANVLQAQLHEENRARIQEMLGMENVPLWTERTNLAYIDRGGPYEGSSLFGGKEGDKNLVYARVYNWFYFLFTESVGVHVGSIVNGEVNVSTDQGYRSVRDVNGNDVDEEFAARLKEAVRKNDQELGYFTGVDVSSIDLNPLVDSFESGPGDPGSITDFGDILNDVELSLNVAWEAQYGADSGSGASSSARAVSTPPIAGR